MKLFLTKVGLMLSIVVSVLCLISALNWAIVNYSDVFVFDNKIKTLVLGDSHTKYGINDKLLRNTINVSQSADSYFYSYQKLKIIKSKNPQIDTLLLSFSQHNIEEYIESRWLFNKSLLNSRIRYYYPIMDKNDLKFLFNNKPTELVTNLFSQALNPMYIYAKGRSVYGGYADIERNQLTEDIANLKNTPKPDFKEAKVEIYYLVKIIEYCKLHNIKLFLINTPQHFLVNKDQSKFFEMYKRKFASVTFLDFSKLKMPEDCYGDLYHLTPKGANFFTNLIGKNGLNNLEQLIEDKHYATKLIENKKQNTLCCSKLLSNCVIDKIEFNDLNNESITLNNTDTTCICTECNFDK